MLKLIRLEERIVLDGAMVDTVANTGAIEFFADAAEVLEQFVDEAFQQVAPAAGDARENVQKSLDIILIASDLPDIQQLVAAAQPGAYVHVFDVNETSAEILARVTDFAEQQGQPIDNLALVTHGNAGSINFGSTAVSNVSLIADSSSWQTLGSYMSANASLQVYGCDVASNADGVQLVQNLAALTGADVQASDDLTGAGGDWQLEVASSAVEVLKLLDGADGYAHTLVDPVLNGSQMATVAEGEIVTITTAMLHAEDSDTPDARLEYQITAGPNNGVVTLNGTAIGTNGTFTQEDIDNGLVQYRHDGSEVDADTFDFVVTDNTFGSDNGTFNLMITPRNDAPTLDLDTTLDGRGFRGGFDEDGVPVPIINTDAGGLTIFDPDSTQIQQAVITLTNVFDAAQEELAFDALDTGLMIDYNADRTEVTISGVASVNDYERVLQTGTYANNSNSDQTPSRVIDIRILDVGEAGTIDSFSNFSTAILASQNSPPVIDAPDTAMLDEDNQLVFNGIDAGTISVSDPDARADDPVTITLAATNGGLELNSIVGLTFVDADGTDGTLQFTGTLSDVNAALDGLAYNPNQDFNGAATIDIRIDDLGNSGDADGDDIPSEEVDDNLSDTHTINLTVESINDPPVLNTPPPPAQVAEEEESIKIPGLSINDVDAEDGDLSVELNVSNGTIEIDVASSGVTVTAGANGTNMITFTGTLQEINAALDTVCYQSDLHFNGDDVLNFIVDDQGNSGAGDDTTLTGQVDIVVTPVNDPPSVVVPAAQTTNEDTSIDFSAANGIAITFADVDADEDPNAAADARDVQITLDVSNGTLALGNTANLVIVDGDGSDGTLVFQGTLAEVNAAIDTLSYTPNENFNGNDQLTVRIDDLGNYGDVDGDGIFDEVVDDNLFATDTVDITVVAVNDVPVIDLDADDSSGAPGEDFQNTFREDDGPVAVIDDDVTLADADGEPIQEIVITIDNLQDAPQEVLAFDSDELPTGVTPNYDPSTGTLTFTGPASAEDYRDLLATITYDNADQAPSPGDRNISVAVSDGTDTTTVNSTITVVAVDDAPDITVPSNTALQEEVSSTLNDVQVSDIDAGDEDIRVTLTVDTGVLAVADDNAEVAVTGNNSGTVVLVGSQTDINAQLNALMYTPPANFVGNVTFDLNVNDLGNQGEGGPLEDNETTTLTIGPVNDAPIVTVPADQTVAEDEAIVITGVSVADVDANDEDVVVTLNVAQGVLTVDPDPAVTLAGNGSDTVTLTGTIDDINNVIDAITYQGDLNFNGDDTLTVSINDQGNTGQGGPLTDTETVAITVTPVDDQPVIDPSGPDDPNDPDNPTDPGANDPFTNTFTENGPPVSAVDPDAVNIFDPDGDDIASALIQLDILDPSVETLAIDRTTLPNGVTFNYDPATGTATITGNATPDEYEAILATLTYENSSEDPNPADRTIIFTVTDENGTTSEPSNSIIQVVPVNDAPDANAPTTLTANEDVETPVPGVSVTDIDDRGQPISVTVTANNGTLSVPPTTGVTVTGDDSGNLVLQGPEVAINTALAGLTYTGNAEFSGTDTINVVVNDLGNTGLGGAMTDAEAIAVTVTPQNDPPSVTTNDLSYPDDGNVIIGPDNLLAADPDHNPDELTFEILDQPDNGQILLNGVPLQPGQTFTQADINNGLVSYQSNGNEAEADSFTFVVTDADGAATAGQLNLIEEDDFIPDSIDYFDPANPIQPVLPPGSTGIDAPPPFTFTVPPLEPLVPQTDLFASALAGLEGMGGEVEDTLRQGEFTNMRVGPMLMGTAGPLGESGPEIRYACSLLEVLDAGCRFNDAFDQPNAHLDSAQGHVVGNYFNGDQATATPNGAVAALGMALDVFQNCGDANQPPGDFAQSYLNGVTGGEGECAVDEAGIATENAASPVELTGFNEAEPPNELDVRIIPNETNPRDTNDLRESLIENETEFLSNADAVNNPSNTTGDIIFADATAEVYPADETEYVVPNDSQLTQGEVYSETYSSDDLPYDPNLVSEVVVLDADDS